MIRFACPECGASIKAPDEMVGKRAKCPKCGDVVQIMLRDAITDTVPFDPMRALDTPPAAEKAPRAPVPVGLPLDCASATKAPNYRAERRPQAKQPRRVVLWAAITVGLMGLAASAAWYVRGMKVETQLVDRNAEYDKVRQQSETENASLRHVDPELQQTEAILQSAKSALQEAKTALETARTIAERQASRQAALEENLAEQATIQGQLDRAGDALDQMPICSPEDWNRGEQLFLEAQRTGMTNELALEIGGLVSFRGQALQEYLQQHPELAQAASEIEAKFQRRDDRFQELNDELDRTGWKPSIALEYETLCGYDRDAPWSKYLDGIHHPRNH